MSRLILADEIGHVAVGIRWHKEICRRHRLEPEAAFRDAVRHCFKGGLKTPFNREARAVAGFPTQYYEPLPAPSQSG